jgi:hypothetical protein
MSQNDDGLAFLHSDELRASWVHLRSRCLRVRLWLQYICAYGTLMGACTDVRNRREFAQKLKVIAVELRKRMAGVLFIPNLRPRTEYLPENCDDALQSKRNTQKVDNFLIYQCRQRHTQWSDEARFATNCITTMRLVRGLVVGMPRTYYRFVLYLIWRTGRCAGLTQHSLTTFEQCRMA